MQGILNYHIEFIKERKVLKNQKVYANDHGTRQVTEMNNKGIETFYSKRK